MAEQQDELTLHKGGDNDTACVIVSSSLFRQFSGLHRQESVPTGPFLALSHWNESTTYCGAFRRSRCACGRARSVAPAFIYRALGEHKLPRLYWHLELCDLYTPILLHTRARSRSPGNSPQAAAACRAPLLIWTSPAEVGKGRAQESLRAHRLCLLQLVTTNGETKQSKIALIQVKLLPRPFFTLF